MKVPAFHFNKKTANNTLKCIMKRNIININKYLIEIIKITHKPKKLLMWLWIWNATTDKKNEFNIIGYDKSLEMVNKVKKI